MFFFKDNYDENGKFSFDRFTKHCRFKGGSSSTTTYTPTEEEKRLMRLQGDLYERLTPNATWAANKAQELLSGSYGASRSNFKTLSEQAQKQINASNQTVGGLINGKLPQDYVDNTTDIVKRGVQASTGNMLNGLSQRGVINSSVLNQGMKDISDSAANAMTNAYTQNIGLLSGLAGQQVDQATAKIGADAAAREADLYGPLSLMGIVSGVGSVGSGALAGVAGKGTTTTSQKQSSGGLLGGLFGGLF